MNFGVFLPNYGPFGDPHAIVELAEMSEGAGWDGFFLWDHIHLYSQAPGPMVDPWITLAAVATATSKMRLGTLITPLARRRPWKVARESVTLDHLSKGRLTFGIGLGTPPEDEFGKFGEAVGDRQRATNLDEGLKVIQGLWKGEPFTFHGNVHRVSDVCFEPQPLQSEGIPVWGGGWWPNEGPFRRAAQLDGVVPEMEGGGTPNATQVDQIRQFVSQHRRSERPFDIAINGSANTRDPLQDLEAAGVTWWLERFDVRNYSLEDARTRIAAGPR